jgi:hypothetical protein
LQQITLSGDGIFKLLKRQCQRILFSTSGFFHELVSPKRLSIPLGCFEDIRSSRCTTGVVEPVANGKNLKSEKFD